MPYIPQDKRENIDLAIDTLPPDMSIGEVNYTITTLLTKTLAKGYGYKELNALIGVIECIKMELYRRVVVPYENIKEEEFGDVFG